MTEVTRERVWDNTATYEAYMGRWSRPMGEAVLTWLAPPPKLRWLDVGCGTGALTQAILDEAEPSEIVAIDPSADFVTTAMGQIADPRVRFKVGDAQALPVAEGAYDVVVAGLVLHFVPDPLAAVLEMARAACGGGALVAYIWNSTGERQFTRYLWEAAIGLDSTAAAQDPGRHTPLGHPEPLAALFAKAELRKVTVQEVVVPIVFRDFDDYWLPLLMNGSSPAQRYVMSQGEDARAALRGQLHATLPIADDGSISMLGRVWAVRGTK